MSSKQDRSGVRTAQDLEQKYNLKSINTIKKAVERTAQGLISTNDELHNFIDATIDNIKDIQNQVDGNITTWFFSGVPTLENSPANEWASPESKTNHLGDLYYDRDTGYSYRWQYEDSTFSWLKLTDSDITEALALANAAQDTADSKRRVFVKEPITPYDIGDIWFREDELFRCSRSRASGAFNASDFIVATKYTDDTVANEAKAIVNELKTTVETHYVTNTKLETTKDSINSNVEKLAIQVDEKNKVFTTKPTPPYYVGDVYVLNDKIYYCTTERTTGSYTESDWKLSVDAGTLVSKTEFTQTSDSFNASIKGIETGLSNTNSNLEKTNENINNLQNEINGVSADFEDFKDNEYIQSINNLQNQIDGAIQFWNGSEIPTLNNYPANQWTTENDKINHQADIYTVIQDVEGELKQGKAYRFDKVDGTWQWIELTDNELSAVQEIAQNALNKANTNTSDIKALKQTDINLQASLDGIEASVETLENEYQTNITTRKKVSGNPIYIEDSGGYALESDFIYGMSMQEISTQGKNIVPTDFSEWESGHYAVANGSKENYTSRIRVKRLIDVSPNTTYFVNIGTTTNHSFVIRAFNSTGEFVRSIGGVSSGGVFTTGENETKLGVALYAVNESGVTYNTYATGFEDGSIKPFICLNSETDKTFEEYIPNMPKVEIKNVRGIENLLPITLTEKTELGIKSSAIGNTIKIIGKATSGVTIIHFEGELTLKAGTYNFCFYGKKGGDLNFYYTVDGVNNLLANIASNSQYTTVTFNEDTTISRVYSFISNGTVIDAEIQLMITKGSEQLTFVDYGSNYLVQRITGKNQLSKSNVAYNGGGFTYEQIKIGEFIFNGTTTSDTEFRLLGAWNTKNKNILLKNGTYKTIAYLKGNIISTETTVTNGSLTTIYYNRNTYTINDDYNGIATIKLTIPAGTYTNAKLEVMICLNEFDETFEPYKETLIKYDLQGNELCSKEGIADTLEEVSGLLSKRFKKIVLDGSENWLTSLNNYWYYITVPNGAIKQGSLVASTHFTQGNWIINKTNTICLGNSISPVLGINTSIFSTIDDLKTFLSENPVTVYYELEIPETIQLEPTEIKLYEGINNIYTESNIDVEEVDITYLTDSVLNGQYATKSELQITEDSIMSNVNSKIDDTSLEIKQELNTSIQQKAESITSEVASTYAKNDELGSLRTEMSTKFTQTNNTFEMQFKTLNSEVSNIDELVHTNQTTLEKYIRFIDGALELGNNESPISLKIENDMLAFYQNDTKIAYISNNKLYITDGFFTNSLRIDSFGFFKEDNGSLSFGKVG